MNSPAFNIDEKFVKSLLSVVDKGLVQGLGQPVPGQMCVEAAVCYAMGLPHDDKPTCVNEIVTGFKINLNDSDWSSDTARAKGMRRLAVAQLGSNTIDAVAFSGKLALLMAQKLLPIILEKIDLISYAKKCKEAKDLRGAFDVANEVCSVTGGNPDQLNVICDATHAISRALSAGTSAADAKQARAKLMTPNVIDPDSWIDAASSGDSAAFSYAIAANSYAVYAANGANYSLREAGTENPDFYLVLLAQLAEKALVELKSPGCEWLHLCDN